MFSSRDKFYPVANNYGSGTPSHRPSQSTEIFSNKLTSNQLYQHQGSNIQTQSHTQSLSNFILQPGNNMNIAYSELAKQLKNNKHTNQYTNNFNPNNSLNNNNNQNNQNKDLKVINSYNNQAISFINNKNTNTRISSPLGSNVNTRVSNFSTERILPGRESNLSTVFPTKTTKDNSIVINNNSSQASLKISNFMSKVVNNADNIEGPEELHLFYVNIFKNNKKLAIKFDFAGKEDKLHDESNL
jgi:hypothetical protein